MWTTINALNTSTSLNILKIKGRLARSAIYTSLDKDNQKDVVL